MVPSELNVADRASRRWEHLRKSDAVGRATEDAWRKEVHRRCYESEALLPLGRAFPESHPEGQQSIFEEGHSPIGIAEGEGSEEAGSTEKIRGEKRWSKVQRADTVRESSSIPASCHGLSKENKGVEGVCQDKKVIPEQPVQVRRHLLHVRQQHVRSRVRPSRRNQELGGHHRCFPRLRPEAHVSAHQAGIAGLEQAGAPANTSSSPMASHSDVSHDPADQREDCGGSIDSPRVHGLLEARRSLGCAAPRLGAMPGTKHYSSHLHPAQRQQQSKVGLSDETILLDSPLMPWFGACLQKIRSHPIFVLDTTYDKLVKDWKQALRAMGLSEQHAVLYQLRHAGPSCNRHLNLRSLPE